MSFLVVLAIVYVSVVSGKYFHNNYTSRIFDGTEATLGQFPFMVSLRPPNGTHQCGGTIITERWIVTAAHCIRNARTIISVGTVSSSSPGVIYEIEKSIVHPNYTSWTKFRNDIALCKTKKPIHFNENVNKATLPETDISVGANVTIAGWGLIAESVLPEKLMYYSALIIDWNKCREIFNDYVHENDLCVFSRTDQGVCFGDSGGPLIDTETKKFHGVVSRGKECGIGYPDIFTGVYAYIDWIKSIIGY